MAELPKAEGKKCAWLYIDSSLGTAGLPLQRAGVGLEGGGGRIDRFEKIFIPERELPLGVRGAGAAAAAPAMALLQVASLRMRPERQKCGMESERVVRGECFVG